MVGEAVEKADYDKDQSVRDHYDLVAETVDHPAYKRRSGETADCGNREEKAYYHRVGTVEKNEDVRAESEEDLLSRAVKNFDHVVFREFAAEVEAPFSLVGLAASGHPHRKNESEKKYHAAHHEDRLEKRCGLSDEKTHSENYDVSREHEFPDSRRPGEEVADKYENEAGEEVEEREQPELPAARAPRKAEEFICKTVDVVVHFPRVVAS